MALIEATVSLQRIGVFLSANELDPRTIEYARLHKPEKKKKGKRHRKLKAGADPTRSFLLESESEEEEERATPKLRGGDEEEESEGKEFEKKAAITLDNAYFTWDDSGHRDALSNLHARFMIGDISMIIGETGAGKSGKVVSFSEILWRAYFLFFRLA